MYILNEKFKNRKGTSRNLEIENLNNSVYLRRKRLKKGQLKHYPCSVKEWYNSVYKYKKDNYINILPLKDKTVYRLFDVYFNFLRNYKYNSLSMNKIFVGRPEIKHFSNKINITIYIYNKWIKYFFEMTNNRFNQKLTVFFRKLLIKLFSNKSVVLLYKYICIYFENADLPNKYLLNGKVKVINKSVFKESIFSKETKRYLYLCLMNYFFYYIRFPKLVNIMKKVIFSLKEERVSNLIIVLKHLEKIYSKRLEINSLIYLIKLINIYSMINKLLKNIYLLKFFKRNIFFNIYKFNVRSLLIVKNFINKLYNKKIEVNIVNLKYLYLDGSILALVVVKKLKNRKIRVLRVIRMALRLSKKPYFNKFYSDCFNTNSLDNIFIKKNLNFSFNDDCLLLNKNLICKPISYKSRLVFYYLNNKIVSGMKLQGTGRLTKRLTASRSISKSISKGSLKNKVSSYNGLSTVVLRGYVKSNLQYTNINSCNRIGAYGIKSWISNF